MKIFLSNGEPYFQTKGKKYILDGFICLFTGYEHRFYLGVDEDDFTLWRKALWRPVLLEQAKMEYEMDPYVKEKSFQDAYASLLAQGFITEADGESAQDALQGLYAKIHIYTYKYGACDNPQMKDMKALAPYLHRFYDAAKGYKTTPDKALLRMLRQYGIMPELSDEEARLYRITKAMYDDISPITASMLMQRGMDTTGTEVNSETVYKNYLTDREKDYTLQDVRNLGCWKKALPVIDHTYRQGMICAYDRHASGLNNHVAFLSLKKLKKGAEK